VATGSRLPPSSECLSCTDLELCQQGFLPASTFKIMNSLVAIETGVAPDETFGLPWDGTPRAIAAWNRDHTLATAIRHSVVWYYQELARRIGGERMQQALAEARYGNARMEARIDTFWLEGDLRTSPVEQAIFMRRLHERDLPFSERACDIVLAIMELDRDGERTLRGKTGWVLRVPTAGAHVGWFVGSVDRPGNLITFASLILAEEPDVEDWVSVRRGIAERILRDLGYL
jgi:beta-lactamase class D